METIIIEIEGQDLEKIKAFLQDMNLNFQSKINPKKCYKTEFVKIVLDACKGKQAVMVPSDAGNKQTTTL